MLGSVVGSDKDKTICWVNIMLTNPAIWVNEQSPYLTHKYCNIFF